MRDRFFPKLAPGQSPTPRDVAAASAAHRQREAHQAAKLATDRLRAALGVWFDFDSTGNIDGAINHTIVRGEELVERLRELQDVAEPFRDQSAVGDRS
ncbi:hypothetical protein [Glutamicibacter sp. PS]|uniref:hypothetical protein n=1 Tax=Glutamicibacter sp. PS TaxID=3075634 RepID=UPI00283F2492|nr:hypothetical protein [Glutamicibacter sp. PS]MDR4533237.1 hypothetical protein [Glutamicibacter sp. PS]